MRLSEKNIKFVKCILRDGKPVQWFVSVRPGAVSDLRSYPPAGFKPNGYVDARIREADELPKSVRLFIRDRMPEERDRFEDRGFKFTELFWRA